VFETTQNRDGQGRRNEVPLFRHNFKTVAVDSKTLHLTSLRFYVPVQEVISCIKLHSEELWNRQPSSAIEGSALKRLGSGNLQISAILSRLLISMQKLVLEL
jgi:hypothetical protein